MRHDDDPQELRYWLGFTLVPGISGRRITALFQRFGSLSQAWSASEADLRRAGLEGQPLANLLKTRQQIDLNAALARIQRANAAAVTLAMNGYPPLLRDISDAPPLLYVRGEIIEADRGAVAIVGTRTATRYGIDVSYKLARELAQEGVTVISGLAQGIDAAAHRGALDGGGRTIAVLGNGIDSVYPSQNRDLAAQIAVRGALVTEFPIGAKPEAHHFPRRNRVISGMSLGVLIVEAPEKSGALITASAALEQGRDVFAVPGDILRPSSAGANRLIQDGAKLIMDVRDILEELTLIADYEPSSTATPPAKPSHAPKPPEDFDSDIERRIYAMLSTDPVHVDDLIRASGLGAGDVLATLTLLELKDLARNVGGMQYCTGS